MVALIEMEEGVKMMSNVVDVDPNEVSIGMDVQVVFDDVTDEVTLPKIQTRGLIKRRTKCQDFFTKT